MTTRPTIAGTLIGLALVALLFCGMWRSVGGAAPSPWQLGEVTELRTWWWGEVPTAPVVEGDGWVICVAVGDGRHRCTVTSQGLYRRLVVNGVVWEDRRQRIALPAVYVGRVQRLWLPFVPRGAR